MAFVVVLPAAAVLVRLVMRGTARASMGDRLRVRALRRSGLSDSSSSERSSRGCGVGVLLRAAERVTGPEYSTSFSEGVGLGEMTRGVSGMFFERKDMANENGGSAGQRMAPTTRRCKESKPEGQKEEYDDNVEWRYLSRREDRTVDDSGFEYDESVSERENQSRELSRWREG